MASLLRIAILLLVVVAIGCSPGGGSTTVEPSTSSASDLIKSDLQGVADNGMLGSAKMSIEQNIATLKATDAATADELTADLAELEGLEGDAAKKKAEEMIGKLGAAPAAE